MSFAAFSKILCCHHEGCQPPILNTIIATTSAIIPEHVGRASWGGQCCATTASARMPARAPKIPQAHTPSCSPSRNTGSAQISPAHHAGERRPAMVSANAHKLVRSGFRVLGNRTSAYKAPQNKTKGVHISAMLGGRAKVQRWLRSRIRSNSGKGGYTRRVAGGWNAQ